MRANIEHWTLLELCDAANWAAPMGAEDVLVRVRAARMGEHALISQSDDGTWDAIYPSWIAGAMRSACWVLYALAAEGVPPAKEIALSYSPYGYAKRWWRVFDRVERIQIDILAGWQSVFDDTLTRLAEAESKHLSGVRVRGARVTPFGLRVLLSEWPDWAYEVCERARHESLALCHDCGGRRRDGSPHGSQCDSCYQRVRDRQRAGRGDGGAPASTTGSAAARAEEAATAVIRGLLIGDPMYAGGLPPRWCAECRDGVVYRVDMAERIVTSWEHGKRRSAKVVSISDPKIGERMTMRVAGIDAVGAREVVTSEIVALWREA